MKYRWPMFNRIVVREYRLDQLESNLRGYSKFVVREWLPAYWPRVGLIAAIILCIAAFAQASDRDQWEIELAEAAVWTAQNQFPALQVDVFQGPQLPEQDDGRSVQADADLARPPVAETSAETASVVPVKPITFNFAPQTVSIYRTIPCTVHTTKYCVPCKRQMSENEEGDERVSFVYTEDASPSGRYPCTTFVDSTGATRYIDGFRTTDQIWEIIQRNNPPGIQQTYAASGFGGSIHAKQLIKSKIDWWRENVGNVRVQFAWRRTGGQTFPLIHQKTEQWSCANIMGSLGEFTVEAPGSKLPVQPILLGYRRSMGQVELIGKVSIDERRLGFPGDVITSSLPVANQIVEASLIERRAAPAGFGPMALLSIASTIKAIAELLNPHVDLTLGGTVSATFLLDDVKDEFTVTFKDCPGIKIVEWFTFDLKAKRLTVFPVSNPSTVRIELDGSRWIKSRDLRID